MDCVDFRNSYMTWSVAHDPNDRRVPGHKPWGNSARIELEAACTLTEEATGRSDEFYLIAACRTEWMYQEENLFQTPSREYRGIWSATRHRSLGHGMAYEVAMLDPQGERSSLGRVTGDADYELRRSGSIGDTFCDFHLTIRRHRDLTVLESDAQVVAATMQEVPLLVRTEIQDPDRGFTAVLEYPVRTMNFLPDRGRFQVDTGPLIVPDFPCTNEHWIEWLDLAHVAYNTFDRAEFIVQRPTPVEMEGRVVCYVPHFSGVRVCPARHTLMVAGTPRPR